ncbi:ie-1 [Leucania separata nucleopolyhedrovirus]|uniref:Ie-1 n=1 Tax=Leucania separata nucleopolyhedrovirus TaxID=1307956 RepID=Q0ILA3_NPVLS|nr:ie-1 [Leucania separata nucleopolyhedrovirus]AAR28780.1 ie-1 [Leucania separata nucleopolyhedrovirus]
MDELYSQPYHHHSMQRFDQQNYSQHYVNPDYAAANQANDYYTYKNQSLNTPPPVADQSTEYGTNNTYIDKTVAHSTPNHDLVSSIMDVQPFNFNAAGLTDSPSNVVNNLEAINTIVTNDRVNNPIETLPKDLDKLVDEVCEKHEKSITASVAAAAISGETNGGGAEQTQSHALIVEPPPQPASKPATKPAIKPATKPATKVEPLLVKLSKPIPIIKVEKKKPLLVKLSKPVPIVKSEKRPKKKYQNMVAKKITAARPRSIGKTHLNFKRNDSSDSSSSSSESEFEEERPKKLIKTAKVAIKRKSTSNPSPNNSTSSRKTPPVAVKKIKMSDEHDRCENDDDNDDDGEQNTSNFMSDNESDGEEKQEQDKEEEEERPNPIVVRTGGYDDVSSCPASPRSDNGDEPVPEDSRNDDYTEDHREPAKRLEYKTIDNRQNRKVSGKYNIEARASIVTVDPTDRDDQEDEEHREHTRKVNEILSTDRRVFDGKYDMSRRFVEFYTSKLWHMFLITPCANRDGEFELRYINTVHSVVHEYKTYHSLNGNTVVVVTLNRYKFLIVERLLDSMNIAVPLAERVDDGPKENQVSFIDIKDVKFSSLLVKRFDLDTVIAQTELMFLYSAMDRNKGKYVHAKLTSLVEDNTLFTLPVNVSRKDGADTEETVQAMANNQQSKYVTDIVFHAQTVRFNRVDNHQYRFQPPYYYKFIAKLKEELSIWLPIALVKYKDDIKLKRDLTYKYGSVARVFYSARDTDLLKQVRKEKGGRFLVENYLECNRDDTTDSFILIDTKKDERLTIVKKGSVYVWINCVHMEIVPKEIIEKFKYGTHHLLSLNRNTRKEINARHNGLIKLIGHYTSGEVKINHAVMLAMEYFKAQHTLFEFKDGKLQPQRPDIVVEEQFEFVDVFSEEYQRSKRQQSKENLKLKIKVPPKKK